MSSSSSTELKKKQYGLILKGPNAQKEAPQRKVAAVFEDDEGDEQQVSLDVIRDAHKSASTLRQVRAAERLHERALAEDPSVFDYDASYEDIQAKKNEKVAEQKEADKERKSKYAEAIIKAHKRRQLEQASVDERKQLKERATEGDEFADKEVFVTGAYRELMEEVQKFREEEAYEARFNSLTDVQKQKLWQAGLGRQLLNDIARSSDAPKKAEGGAEEKKKERSTRKPIKDEEDMPGGSKTEAKKEPKKKSIYSDDEDETPEDTRNFRGELKPGLNRVVKKEPAKAQTKSEKIRERMFTPSPNASGDEEERRDSRRDSRSPDRRRHRDDSRERDRRRRDDRDRDRDRDREHHHHRRDGSKERGRDKTEKKKKEEEEKKEEPKQEAPKKSAREMSRPERLANLREILKQRNGAEQIAEFHKRFLERKATGFVTIPL